MHVLDGFFVWSSTTLLFRVGSDSRGVNWKGEGDAKKAKKALSKVLPAPLHLQPFSDSLPPSDIALSHLIPLCEDRVSQGPAHHLRPPGMAQHDNCVWHSLGKFEFSTPKTV